MTRFARARGSKASNEKLPEPASSWSEMKQELLNKTREIEERKKRDDALRRRNTNYQAFLNERQEEDQRNTTWADFSEFGTQSKQHKNKKSQNKCKLMIDNIEEESYLTSKEGSSSLETQNYEVLSEQRTEPETESNCNDSGSDSLPEEVSIKEKPEEIVIKKAKKIKQTLKIDVNNEKKFNKVTTETTGSGRFVLIKKTHEDKNKKKNLTEYDIKMIQKKQERYIKQLEKKKLRRLEKKAGKLLGNGQGKDYSECVISNTGDIENDIKLENQQLSENEAEKVKKKLDRRRKQKAKKSKMTLEKISAKNSVNEKTTEHLSEKELAKIERKKQRRARQAEKRKKIREAKKQMKESSEGITNTNTISDNSNGNKFDINTEFKRNNSVEKPSSNKQDNIIKKKDLMNKKPNKNPKKVKDNNELHSRKKPLPNKMFINGKTVDIDYVEGFPVKKEDAERLKQLRKEMISKGLPRSEINVSLKLERRRAEKALAREKKHVCFNCRKSGHNLSECPELGKDQIVQATGTGICFKCGSTEHTHFECKVVRGQEYKFAECFICKEQGHIAKQCPDNQRGLYPKGGSCKVCGDVTHLKKDCPKYQAQQSHLQNLSIETLDRRNPDILDSKEDTRNYLDRSSNKLNKVIKF